jgi:hypothetical protein
MGHYYMECMCNVMDRHVTLSDGYTKNQNKDLHFVYYIYKYIHIYHTITSNSKVTNMSIVSILGPLPQQPKATFMVVKLSAQVIFKYFIYC